MAALSAAVRLNIGTIWVKATPMRERTYPSKNEPPLEKKDILRRNGVMATSSIVFFAAFLADEGMSFTLAAILCARRPYRIAAYGHRQAPYLSSYSL